MAVALPVGPFAGEGLLVALDLAVAFRGAGRDPAVLDAAGGEQLTQRAVADVDPGVVCLESFRLDPVAFEELQRALDEAGHGCCALVWVDLGEREPRVVVDDRVAELPTNTGASLGRSPRTIAGDGMTWPREPREAFGVHLQQIAGAETVRRTVCEAVAA